MTDLIPPPRRRGGQPGNLNALKHSRFLTTDPLEKLTPIDSACLSDLGKYIKMLKHFMHLVYEEGLESSSMTEARMTLHVLSLAGLSINRLTNLQRRLNRQTRPLKSE